MIRHATVNDCQLIRHLACRIWPKAYYNMISAGQLEYMLHRMYNTQELTKQLEEGHKFFIAEENGEAVGFAGTSLVEPGTYKLHKLYVLPAVHGKGFGEMLLNHVQQFARQQGANTLILGVNRENRAFGFYQRQEFTVREEVNIDIGKGFFMNDFVMQKSLRV